MREREKWFRLLFLFLQLTSAVLSLRQSCGSPGEDLHSMHTVSFYLVCPGRPRETLNHHTHTHTVAFLKGCMQTSTQLMTYFRSTVTEQLYSIYKSSFNAVVFTRHKRLQANPFVSCVLIDQYKKVFLKVNK